MKSTLNFEPVLIGAVEARRLFFLAIHCHQYSDRPGSSVIQSRIKVPRSFGKRRGRSPNIMAASTGFSSAAVQVLVSFYRTGKDSVRERHRSRDTFNSHQKTSNGIS